jgi:hypothetical protein
MKRADKKMVPRTDLGRRVTKRNKQSDEIKERPGPIEPSTHVPEVESAVAGEDRTIEGDSVAE